jgi:hypothetical protein
MRAMNIRRAYRMAIRGNRVFYRLIHKSGGLCFSVSRVGGGHLGGAACPSSFPTPQLPVLDLSIYESVSHDEGPMSLYRAEGVTADGVADVDFIGPNGSIVAHVAVVGNIYSVTAPPQGKVKGLIAHDATGQVVFRTQFSR